MFVPGLPPSSKRAGRPDQTIAAWEDDGGAVTTLKALSLQPRTRWPGPDLAGPRPMQRNTDTSH
jgi:hypothetical protein